MARAIKDSGIDWIGEIPASWKLSRVKNHYNIISGSGFKPEFQGNSKGDFPVCKASDISNAGNKLTIAANYITKQIATSEGFTVIPKGSLLFAKIGEAMKKNNRTIATVDCCVDNNCQGLVPKNINVEYGFYLFKCIDMEWFDNAGTIPCINNQKLLSLSLPFPPLAEQQKIAAFLDKQCSEIDAVLTKTKESIEEYKLLKNAIITQAVTKGIRPNRKMKDSGIEWIGEIPEDWDCFYLSQIFAPVKNKNVGLQENNLLSLSYGKIIRKNINTTFGLLPENFEGYNIIQADDLVLRLTDLQNDHKSLRVGLAKEKGIITSAYLSLRNKSNNLPLYFYYLLHTFDILKGFYGMGAGVRQGLNWDEVRSLRITAPKDISEQKEIVDYLEEKCSQIETLITKKEQLITELETYKKSLIYEYVTGKKEVQ